MALLSFIHASSDGQFASPGYTLHLEVDTVVGKAAHSSSTAFALGWTGFALADPARRTVIQKDGQDPDRRVVLTIVSN